MAYILYLHNDPPHVKVTNGYEAYQMIVFGELANWPGWADVLSR